MGARAGGARGRAGGAVVIRAIIAAFRAATPASRPGHLPPQERGPADLHARAAFGRGGGASGAATMPPLRRTAGTRGRGSGCAATARAKTRSMFVARSVDLRYLLGSIQMQARYVVSSTSIIHRGDLRMPQLEACRQGILSQLGRGSSCGTSTTHMAKLLPRIEGGDGAGCPLIAFGIKPSLYAEDAAE